MSLLVLSAKALGTLIGYSIQLEAIQLTKKKIGQFFEDEEIPDELANALLLLESREISKGIELLVLYRQSNPSSPGFRVVKELYLNELEEIVVKLQSKASSDLVILRGPANLLCLKSKDLINTLATL